MKEKHETLNLMNLEIGKREKKIAYHAIIFKIIVIKTFLNDLKYITLKNQ